MNASYDIAQSIFQSATPILKIHGLGGSRWKRNVAKGSRIGPWLQADYTVLDPKAWAAKGACLYLVQGGDAGIRYVGISRNGVRHRWRESPALDAETGLPLPGRQLFHSQCWKFIEQEFSESMNSAYEVRSIEAQQLRPVLARLGAPLSGFLALGNDDEGIVAAVERWLCNNRSKDVARWNVAMTR